VNNVLKSVTQWLDKAAERFPDKIAFGTELKGRIITLTFSELQKSAKIIGAKIAQAGFFKEPVLLAMDKTPECVAAMLGCAYANCPYTPIDVENPPERIAKIIEKLKPCACITTSKYAEKLGETPNIWLYDELLENPVEECEELLSEVKRKIISSDILYIIFTSGSTGIPKGVAVSNANLIDYTFQLSETFGFGEETIFGQSLPFFCDGSILNIYQTIKNGCTDWIIDKTSLMFASKTIDFLDIHKCNTIYWVPTSYNIIANSRIFDKRIPEHLKNCFFVGEVMPNRVLNIWRKFLPNARFVNLFGPTEITDTFLHYVVDKEFDDSEPLPIGKRYDNCDVFLLTDDNTPTPDGEIGELCVRGTKVSSGYWNDPEKTTEVFVQNPLNPHYREIIYKTGDLAYVNEHGEFMYCGRKDFMIKHAGHRIELGEIEIAANSIPGVDLCACVFDTENNIIVMFFVGSADEKVLRNKLKAKLQSYMIPDSFRKIETIPRTGSGKISRVDLLKYIS
jgi:amino acid adenylation domain-containing protein